MNRELFTLRLELEPLDVVLELEFTSSLGELGLKSSDVVDRWEMIRFIDVSESPPDTELVKSSEYVGMLSEGFDIREGGLT